MRAMDARWTDERLDDRFDKLEERLEEHFIRWEERFDRWQRLMFSIMATLVIGLLTMAISHL